MHPVGFDRPDSESVFLQFVAREFQGRGIPRPKELASKPAAQEFVTGLGLRVPTTYGNFADIDAFLSMNLPSAFVLKPKRGWSARGVMLLTETAEGSYFDHLALREHTRESVVATQKRLLRGEPKEGDGWLVEEAVESALSVGPVPFDYKFYSFNGNVGLIVQIDRNTSPTKVAMFDGAFRPLEYGTDYIFGRARPAEHIVPLHAPEMLYWAQELSRQAQSPFVRIDLYDSPSGPYFGEFTYSPGGVHKRMFVFSESLIDTFDSLMQGSGPKDRLSSSSLAERQQVVRPEPSAYTAWASYAYNQGARGAQRLHQFYAAHVGREDTGANAWADRLSRRWDERRRKLVAEAPKAPAKDEAKGTAKAS